MNWNNESSVRVTLIKKLTVSAAASAVITCNDKGESNFYEPVAPPSRKPFYLIGYSPHVFGLSITETHLSS
jgi:hypothetical protein